MTNKHAGLKYLIWAGGILICLVALVIGFFFAAISRYSGDRERPVLNLSEKADADSGSVSANGIDAGAGSGSGYATSPTGALKTLAETGDGGQT